MKVSEKEQDLLYAKLNMETAQMPWRELQRFFASGRVIAIDDNLDMIRVAVMMAKDDKDGIAGLIEKSQISKVSDEKALAWFDADASLWTVVVRPWILVQEKKQAVPPGELLH